MLYHRIPQELNDEIIEYLWDNQAALKACALTCQSFLPASQKQLFSDISVFPSETLQRGPTSSKFIRLLEDAPYISEYVHTLEIRGLSSPGQTTDWHDRDRDLISCLRFLRRLTALKIRCEGKFETQRWKDIRRGGLLMALLETMKLPTLTSLDLDCLPFSMVTQCSALKNLTLRSPDSTLLIDNMPLPTYVYPEFLRLDLREPSDLSRKLDRTTDWGEEIRKSQIDVGSLKALSIITNVREWEEHCGGWTILKASAATLETLALEIDTSPGMFLFDTPFITRALVEDPLDWSSLKTLRILQIRVTVVAADDQWGLGFCNLLPWVSGLLRELTSLGSSDIEELAIQVNYRFLDNRTVPVIMPWKNILSLVFQQTRFPRLQKIHVTIASESSMSYQSTGIVQQIRRYARAMQDGSRHRVSVSLSNKFVNEDLSPLPMEKLTMYM